MEMVLPACYVVIEEEEMMYLDGGFSIIKGVFKTACIVGATAALTVLSGGISIAGLRTVLGSYSMRKGLAASIVKAAGVLGIKAGNALQSKLISSLAGASLNDLFGWVFTKYIDGLDGKINGWVKVF